jgi:hypothetical protein
VGAAGGALARYHLIEREGVYGRQQAVYDGARRQQVTAWDYRPTLPAALRDDLERLHREQQARERLAAGEATLGPGGLVWWFADDETPPMAAPARHTKGA